MNAALISWNEQRRDWVAKKTREQPQSQDLREPVIGLALLAHTSPCLGSIELHLMYIVSRSTVWAEHI